MSNFNKGVIAKKVCMKHVYENGVMVPVTCLEVQDCQIIDTRTKEKDGYNAVVLGAFNQSPSRVAKPQLSQYEKINVKPKRIVKEFRLDSAEGINIGDNVDLSMFSKGAKVVIKTNKTKGKGFAGTMKRFNFSGGYASHGASKSHRLSGSTGSCQDPGRVPKGAKMPGRMNGGNASSGYLKVVNIIGTEILVKGSVPGSNNSFVKVEIVG